VTKTMAAVLSIGLTLAILAPVSKPFRGAQKDSFPLSWYPMFSRPRPAQEPAHYVIGITADGQRYVVHSRHYVGGRLNQARRQLDRLARNEDTARDLCEDVAGKFAELEGGLDGDLVQIWVVYGLFDVKAYFGEGRKAPTKETIRWACQIPGRKEFRLPERGKVFEYEAAP